MPCFSFSSNKFCSLSFCLPELEKDDVGWDLSDDKETGACICRSRRK